MKSSVYQLKSQDIVLLLKIISMNDPVWNQKPTAAALGMSQSELSESVRRSKYAGLLDPTGKTVMKHALLQLLEHGIAYVFPQRPGSLVRGVPTAHSSPPLNKLIQSGELYVWPYAKGKTKGLAIQPLYPSVPEAAEQDTLLHELLSLTDTLRVGKVREKELAVIELQKRFGIAG